MRGTSLRSLTAVRDRFTPVLAAAGSDVAVLGEQLFSVLDALDSSASLRRSLSDPARVSADKAALARNVIPNGFDPRVIEVIEWLAAQRWVLDTDIADAVERLAVEATLKSADVRGQLAVVERELFTFVRALIDSSEARAVLSDPAVNAEARVRLLSAILGDRGDVVSRQLAARATRSPRGRRFSAILGWYGDVAAELRDRIVALVTTGSAFSTTQLERLESLLASAYGRQVHMNVNVDPSFLGGLRVQVGPEVMDATVLTRLVAAQRRLAG